jgi:hypothetical protein
MSVDMGKEWITLEEFEKRLVRVGDCLEWAMGRHPSGYGAINTGGKIRTTHRVAWTLRHGDPGDRDVCHHCDNPPCCADEHLFLGDARDNGIDMSKKGRARAQTDPDIARDIYRALSGGETQVAIADRFSVSRNIVVDILRGRSWTWLREELGPIAERCRRAKKLTADDASEIRRLRSDGWTYPAIAAKFDIHHSMAMKIVSGKQWKDA